MLLFENYDIFIVMKNWRIIMLKQSMILLAVIFLLVSCIQYDPSGCSDFYINNRIGQDVYVILKYDEYGTYPVKEKNKYVHVPAMTTIHIGKYYGGIGTYAKPDDTFNAFYISLSDS